MYKNDTLCWKCANAYGDCEWTEVDAETNRVRFAEVPGWSVKRRNVARSRETKIYGTERIIVLSCPKFVPDRTIAWELDNEAKRKAVEDAAAARKAEEARKRERLGLV